MFWLSWTNVSTELTYVSTVLELFFDCARPMFRLCSSYVSIVLDVGFDFLDRSWVCSSSETIFSSIWISEFW